MRLKVRRIAARRKRVYVAGRRYAVISSWNGIPTEISPNPYEKSVISAKNH